MDSKEKCVLLLVKLIWADGRVDEAEREEFEALLIELRVDASLDDQVKRSKEFTIDDLCNGLDNVADRFFTRVRCHLMVRVDGEVDLAEQAMLDKIISHLPLNSELENLLDLVLDAEERQVPLSELSKIEELYVQSSFSVAS